MSNIYNDRINALRALMRERDIDVYFIPMDDSHNSEYVGDHFKTIEFMSGFSGSAAQMVITADEARLWTDGRYFLQAEDELSGSEIELMKMGNDGVPEIADYINGLLLKGGVLGFDGRMVNKGFADKITGQKKYSEDLAGMVWSDRPAQVFTDIKIFEKQSGVSASEKIADIRNELKNIAGGKYVHVINSLDDIAWLLNIRANDVAYNPVAYSYLTVTEEEVVFYTAACIGDELAAHFKDNGIKIGDYKSFEEDAATALNKEKGSVVVLDPKRIGYGMYMNIEEAGFEIKEADNPSAYKKAIKNETEIRNTTEAQKKDGAALVKFMKWIKERAGKEVISECDVADKLVEFRSEQAGFLEPSFATIAGYKDNAAIIHYEPERGKDKKVEACGMLLVDSGGHYEEGTTDTTRTFILGEVSEEEKKCFTLVAAAMLRLLDFNERKTEECFNGIEGDRVARELLLKHGYDYNHGTGHGIGYVLNVHETPPSISKPRPGSVSEKELEPGMIMSDEPGIYVDGHFGIRTENNMLVVLKEDDEGNYRAFENMTFVPIDIDGIDARWLEPEDIQRLNNYNRLVYNAISDRLDAETGAWLREYTREI